MYQKYKMNNNYHLDATELLTPRASFIRQCYQHHAPPRSEVTRNASAKFKPAPSKSMVSDTGCPIITFALRVVTKLIQLMFKTFASRGS